MISRKLAVVVQLQQATKHCLLIVSTAYPGRRQKLAPCSTHSAPEECSGRSTHSISQRNLIHHGPWAANPAIFSLNKKRPTTKKASPNDTFRNAFQCFIQAGKVRLLLAALCGSLGRTLRWSCCCCTFFSGLLLLLAKQSLRDSNFRKSQRTTSGGKAVFFNQPCNSLTARQHVTRSRKAKSGPESLVN